MIPVSFIYRYTWEIEAAPGKSKPPPGKSKPRDGWPCRRSARCGRRQVRGQTDREHGSEPLKARIRAHGRNGGREVAGRLERSPAAKAGQQRPRKGHRQPMPMSREALQDLQRPSPADPLPQWRPSPLKQRIGSDFSEQCQDGSFELCGWHSCCLCRCASIRAAACMPAACATPGWSGMACCGA